MNGLKLRSNPTASLAYRNLSQTPFSLNNTLQRLSSGLRINKATDDFARSAISTRMNNQIQGMKQANEFELLCSEGEEKVQALDRPELQSDQKPFSEISLIADLVWRNVSLHSLSNTSKYLP